MKKKNYPAYIYRGGHTAEVCEMDYEQRRWEFMLLLAPTALKNVAALSSTALTAGLSPSVDSKVVATGVNEFVNLILQQYYEEV
ncbi:MAG: hypothetical protein WC372_11715 [Candidatus Neomarinimicrobiota bacterium]|jgi:hypothetical protein